MPPAPPIGPERDVEIERRRALLPVHMRRDPAYHPRAHFWNEFLEWEHEERRRSHYVGDFLGRGG